jgi:hypothetical protein
MAVFVSTTLGGIPGMFGAKFGDIGVVIAIALSLVLMFFLWRVTLNVRRRDAV